MIVFILIVTLCFSNASPVLYRISEPGDASETEGKWMRSGLGRARLIPELTQRVSSDPSAVLGRSSQPYCSHQYALSNVGQSGYPSKYTTSNYPYQSGYPLYYYLQYAAPVSAPAAVTAPPATPLPPPQPQLQMQQKPAPVLESYPKQPSQYDRPTTPAPPKPLSPVTLPSISYPVSSSSWQSYMCSVFPYLPSCQAQAQQAPLLTTYPGYGSSGYPGYGSSGYPGYGSSGYPGYGSYPGYPGYQQMAQYPVYYIVQSDTRPSSNVAAPPGTVGIIKISGPTPIKTDVGGKPQPVETDVKEVEKPQDVKGSLGSNGDSVHESSESPAQDVKTETTKQPTEKNSSSE